MTEGTPRFACNRNAALTALSNPVVLTGDASAQTRFADASDEVTR